MTNCQFIVTERGTEHARHPLRDLLRSENVVKDNLKRPWLEQISCGFTEHRNECDCEHFPVRPKQIGNLYQRGSGVALAGPQAGSALYQRKTSKSLCHAAHDSVPELARL